MSEQIEYSYSNKLPTPRYRYITKEEEARSVIDTILAHPLIALDTETTGFDPYTSKLVLVQIRAGGNVYIFDVRYDTEYSNVHPSILNPIFLAPGVKKILQNALFDVKVIKIAAGVYIVNIYDTMLSEQLLYLGLNTKADLASIVFRYLGIEMPKTVAVTFKNYYQKFQPYQLEYAANDVIPLPLIYDLQRSRVIEEGLEGVHQLEFDFVKPLAEMELNGIKMDVDKWRIIMGERQVAMQGIADELGIILSTTNDQPSFLGIPSINIDSNQQLLMALQKYGLPELESTDVHVLNKYRGLPVIDKILDYRGSSKLVKTYGDNLLNQINPVTGRLHTEFKQLVRTGRLSSSKPNLQNIPNAQLFRTGFIAKEGYSLLTADMAGAELRILGNLSKDHMFINAYAQGKDLHTEAASNVFNVPYDDVSIELRKKIKAVQFGIIYGLSKFGLARDLGCSVKEAEDTINAYFETYKEVKDFLDKAARFAVDNGYCKTISGRKRYFNIPEYFNPDFKFIIGGIERAGKNTPIQGSNADTIKKSMNYLVDRLEKGGYDAKLVLTVHDEVVVETKNEQVEEVKPIIEQSLIDGFGYYFDTIPMEADVLEGPCWLKNPCNNMVKGKKCLSEKMKFVGDEKYGTKLVCDKCGAEQK